MGNNMKEHCQRMAEDNTEFEKEQGEADSNLIFPRTARHQPKHILYNLQLICRR